MFTHIVNDTLILKQYLTKYIFACIPLYLFKEYI